MHCMHGYLPHMPKSPLGGTHGNCLAIVSSLREGMQIHFSFRHHPTNQFLPSPWCWKGVARDPTLQALAWCHRRWSYWNKASCKGVAISSQTVEDTSLMSSPVSLEGKSRWTCWFTTMLEIQYIDWLLAPDEEKCTLAIQPLEHGISKKTIR